MGCSMVSNINCTESFFIKKLFRGKLRDYLFVARFEEGLIKDFYTYFEEPWAMALFHDRFEDLLLEIREILTNPPPVRHLYR